MSFTTVCLRSQQGEEKRESGSSLESVSCVTGVFLYTLHPSSLLNLTCVVMTEICAVKEFTVVLFNVEMLMIIQLSVASAKWLNHERESSFMATLWRTWLWLLSYCVPRYCVYLRIYIYKIYIYSLQWVALLLHSSAVPGSVLNSGFCLCGVFTWVGFLWVFTFPLTWQKQASCWIGYIELLHICEWVCVCVWMSVID